MLTNGWSKFGSNDAFGGLFSNLKARQRVIARLSVFVVLLGAATGVSFSQPTLSNFVSGDGGPVTSTTIYPYGTTVSGHAFCVLAHWDNQSVTATVNDNVGNTYVPVAGPVNFGPNERAEVWCANNIVGTSDLNVNIFFSAKTTRFSVVDGWEIAGQNPVTLIDTVGSNTGNGTAMDSGTATSTTNANDMILGVFAEDSYMSPYSAGSGYSFFAYDASTFIEDRTVASVTAPRATATASGAANWAAFVIAIRGQGPPDTTPPTTPTGLAKGTVTTSTVALSWNASTDPDNTASQIAYNVFRNGTKVATTTGGTTNYVDNGLTASTTYVYTVSAQDPAGNASAQSASVSATTLADTTAPSVPTGLTATVASSVEIDLSWNASTDPDSPVAGYNVFRNGVSVASVTGTSYRDMGVKPSTTYSYSVNAFDPAGNTSALSAPVSATTPAPPTLSISNFVSGDSGPTTSSTIYPYGTTVSGHAFCVLAHWDSQSITATVSDTVHNTYVSVAGPINYGPSERAQVWCANNIIGTADANITVTFSARTTRFSVVDGWEISGQNPVSLIDTVTFNTGNGTSMDTGTASTTIGANDMILGVFAADGYTSPYSAGAGYTFFAYDASTFIEDKLIASVTAPRATATASDLGNWAGFVIAIKGQGTPGAAAPMLSTALSGSWLFEEGSGAVAEDSSGHHNNPVLMNGAAWGPGKTGFGISIPGTNDHVRVPYSSSFNLSPGGNEQFTIMGWVKLDSINDLALFAQQNYGISGWYFGINSDGTVSGVFNDPNYNRVTGKTSLIPGNWYHIAFAYNDGGTAKIYVNGVLDGATSNLGPGITVDTADITLGNSLDGGMPLNGTLDAVHIYKKALSATSILDIYNFEK